jgi:hypothetical protein
MVMLRATICKLSEDFDYEKPGEVIWDGKEIRVDRDISELHRIAAEPCWLGTPDKVEEFNPKDDPEAWILNLHRRYPSPGIRAIQASSTKRKLPQDAASFQLAAKLRWPDKPSIPLTDSVYRDS